MHVTRSPFPTWALSVRSFVLRLFYIVPPLFLFVPVPVRLKPGGCPHTSASPPFQYSTQNLVNRLFYIIPTLFPFILPPSTATLGKGIERRAEWRSRRVNAPAEYSTCRVQLWHESIGFIFFVLFGFHVPGPFQGFLEKGVERTKTKGTM